MAEPEEIVMQPAGEEFRVCPACGYALGFHTSFVSASAGKNNPVRSTREVYRVILICPECGARYVVGWRISLAEFESRFIKTTTVPVVSVAPAQKKQDGQVPVVTQPARLPPAPQDHEEIPHE
jgi:hypothetical protein